MHSKLSTPCIWHLYPQSIICHLRSFPKYLFNAKTQLLLTQLIGMEEYISIKCPSSLERYVVDGDMFHLSTPKLWASIQLFVEIHNAESCVMMVKSWLIRSGTCPLSIVLKIHQGYKKSSIILGDKQ